MLSKFKGCINIDWDSLISHLKTQQGDSKTPDVRFYQNTDGRFNEMITLWKSAEYDKSNSVEWVNYYPGKHFSEDYVKQLEQFTNTKCARAWVSTIKPGKMAPLHNDVDDNEEQYLAQGKLLRFTCHISKPIIGQLFVVETDTFHCQEQGSVYQWPSYKSWHAGVNASFEIKYLFNFLAIVS